MDYSSQLNELIEATTCSLRGAVTAFARWEAIVEYLRRGFAIGATSGELLDFLCVSTPNIVEEAGYCGDDAKLLLQMYGDEHDRMGAR